MENDLNRNGRIIDLFLLVFFGSCLVILFGYIFVCAYNSTKDPQNANAASISEEADHYDGISVECPYCGKRAKLVLEIDEK